MTGRLIYGKEAMEMGLVNYVYPDDQLLDKAMEYAEEIAAGARVAIRFTKIAINRAYEEMGFLSTMKHNLELMTHFDTTVTPEREEFNAIRNEKGLRGALDWRDARFRDV